MTLKWEGDKAKGLVKEAEGAALWDVGQYAIELAQNDVPIESGTLRRSAVVTVGTLPDPGNTYEKAKSGKPEIAKGSGDTVFVSYNTPYAVHLHENLNWKPRWWKRTAQGNIVDSPQVGGPKWLEKAMPKAWKSLKILLRREMRKRGM